jgi:Major Facilitator Superfamily
LVDSPSLHLSKAKEERNMRLPATLFSKSFALASALLVANFFRSSCAFHLTPHAGHRRHLSRVLVRSSTFVKAIKQDSADFVENITAASSEEVVPSKNFFFASTIDDDNKNEETAYYYENWKVNALDHQAEQQQQQERAKIIMLSLLWTVAALSSLDRVAMSVALVPMSAEFGFNDSIKGSISSLFSVGYGLCIVPAGLLVASASPRIIMACGVTIWSLATIITPTTASLVATAGTMAPLLLARALMGSAESVVMPTIQRLLAAWTKPEEKR